MEIEQLRHFVRVADEENFTRAAESIGLTQPTLSRSIARLEEELGQPLFERQTRKVALTDAGQILLNRARNILIQVDDARTELIDDGQSGRVRVAAIPTIAPYFLPECLHQFHRQYPHAQVIVLEDTTNQVLKKLQDGEVDFAIAALPIVSKHLEIETLFEEELLLVMSSEHSLAQKKSIRTTDISHLPFILLGETHCLSDNVVAFCRQKSFQPVSVERTSQLATVQELVTLGHGVSLIPAMAASRDQSPSRVYRSLHGDKPTRTIVTITNGYRYKSRLAREFHKHLKAASSRSPVREKQSK